MAFFRCNRCGHLAEPPEDLLGSRMACPACGAEHEVYPTLRFVRTLLDRYFAARRELADARHEIDALKARLAEPAPAAPAPAPADLPHAAPPRPRLDVGDTDHFCSKLQIAPVLDWLRQFPQLHVDLDPRSLDTSGPWDEVSAAIGADPVRAGDLVTRIRHAQQQDYSFLNLDLGRRTPEDTAALHAFGRQLAGAGLLAKFLAQEGEPVVRLSMPKGDAARRFFEGGWLTWFAFMASLRHLVACGRDFSVARDISLDWPRDEGHRLDMLYLIDGLPLAVQCRVGDPSAHMERLLHLRDRLGIVPDRYLLCVAEQTPAQADALARRHGVPVDTPATLAARLQGLLPAA
ncbi:MAG: hypothetical protein RL456_1732 [Pseudomonadota bacterium]|jgi:hypothetical protein